MVYRFEQLIVSTIANIFLGPEHQRMRPFPDKQTKVGMFSKVCIADPGYQSNVREQLLMIHSNKVLSSRIVHELAR